MKSKTVTIKNYIYGLFNGNDEQIDQTSIDEENDDLAWYLFASFAQTEGYPEMIDPEKNYSVVLLAVEDEEVDEDG